MVKNESDDLRFKRLSLEINTSQVYNVEVADFTGRIGESIDKSLEYLEGFKRKCEELNIWDTYYEIPNSKHLSQFEYNLARWNILFHGREENDTRLFEKGHELTNKEPVCELMLTVGIPGSGKTTHTDKLYPHIKKISPDLERAKLLGDVNDQSKNDVIFTICERQLINAMKSRTNVIFDATNGTRKRRRRFLDIARRFGARVTILYFDIPLDVALKRNMEREKTVSEDFINFFYSYLQSPHAYEYDKLLVINDSERFKI
jgi:predicted kinase